MQEEKKPNKTEIQWRIYLGDFFGFPFYIHLSFLIFFIFLFWGDWVATLLFICAMLISILLHEFGHALASRMLGFGQGSMTIWFYGGYFVPLLYKPVFDLNQSQRLKYAAMIFAGPLVNFLLAGIGITLASIFSLEMYYSFARINLTLAIINLLPVPRLDGSNILIHLGSNFISWRKLFVISGVISFGGAIIGILGSFLEWFTGGYTNLVVFMIVAGISLINESSKSEEEIRDRDKTLVENEKKFILKSWEQYEQKKWISNLARTILILALMVFTGCVIYFTFLYSNIPGKLGYVASVEKEPLGFYIANISGYPSKLTFPLEEDEYVEVSRSGNYLAYLCELHVDTNLEQSVCIYDLNKAQFTQFDNFVYMPKMIFSPDDKYLLYSSILADDFDGIRVLDLRTNKNYKIIPSGTPYFWMENNKILYTQIVDGQTDICTLDISTGEFEKITDDSLEEFPLAYSIEKEKIYYFEKTKNSIYQINMKGEEKKLLYTFDIFELPNNNSIGEYWVKISPSGDRFVYEDNGWGVSVVDMGQNTVDFIGEGHNPIWTPDGNFILYRTSDDEHIRISKPDGSLQMNLVFANEILGDLFILP